MRLRGKIVTTFVVIVAVITVALVSLAGLSIMNLSQESLASHATERLGGVAARLELLFSDKFRLLAEIAASSNLQVPPGSLPSYVTAPEQTLPGPESYNATQRMIAARLAEAQVGFSDINRFQVGLDDGSFMIYPPTPPVKLPAKYDSRTRPWFTPIIESKLTEMRIPLRKAADGSLLQNLSRRLYDAHNQPIGVLSVSISLKTITEEIEKIHFGQYGFAVVTELDSTVMVFPKHPELLNLDLSQLPDKALSGLATMPNGSRSIEWKGFTWTVVASRPENSGLAYYGFLRQDEVMAPTFRISTRLLLLATVLLIVFAGAGLIVAIWFSKPIMITSEWAVKIAGGQLRESIPERYLTRKDEIGELSRSLSAMHQKLSDQLESLHQNAEVLSRKNRELEEFSYVASHDLQEPLRKIQAFGDRIVAKTDSGIDEQSRDYLRRMQNAASRMQTLINDLLTFSRVSTHAKAFAPVDLNLVAAEVVADLELYIDQEHGTVEVGPLPNLEAEPTHMRQLLQNLISNGLKFHRPDVPPVVHVEAEVSRKMCVLRVRDEGIGFDMQYVEKVFQPFQRLVGRSEYVGSGIGLAVVRKIVELHDGTVEATSKIDQGTTFTIRLPLKQKKNKSTAD